MEFKMIIFSECSGQGAFIPDANDLAAILTWLNRMKDFGSKHGVFSCTMKGQKSQARFTTYRLISMSGVGHRSQSYFLETIKKKNKLHWY